MFKFLPGVVRRNRMDSRHHAWLVSIGATKITRAVARGGRPVLGSVFAVPPTGTRTLCATKAEATSPRQSRFLDCLVRVFFLRQPSHDTHLSPALYLKPRHALFLRASLLNSCSSRR